MAERSGIVGGAMNVFDKAVELVPHEGTRVVLSAARGNVESAITDGATQGAEHAKELQDAMGEFRGMAGLVSSPLLTNTPVSLWTAGPAIGCTMWAYYIVQRSRRPSVPTIEAGPQPTQMTTLGVAKRWLLEWAPATSKFHATQMLMHGAAVCFAVYLLKFVAPRVKDVPATSEKASQFKQSIRAVVAGSRKLLGSIAGSKRVPLSIQRFASCDIAADCRALLRASLLGYTLHTGVVLYAERVKTAVEKRALTIAHVTSFCVDIGLGVWATFAPSLPPIAKLIATGSMMHAVSSVTAPIAAPWSNTTDGLRVVLATSSLAKSFAIASAATYGAPGGMLWVLKALNMALLVPTANAFELPVTATPLKHPKSLPGVAAAQLALNGLTLLSLRGLKRGALAPTFSVWPLSRRPVSLLSVMVTLDTLALIGIVMYQVQTNKFLATTQRVEREPEAVPAAAAAVPPAPGASSSASPKVLDDLSKEFDFANTARTDFSDTFQQASA